MISAIQFRGETDPDIVPHVHQRCVEEKVVQPTREVQYCKQTLIHVLQDVMTSLARMKVSLPFTEKENLSCQPYILVPAALQDVYQP